MNIRTRTWPSTRSCGPCRSTIRTWRSPAIPTSRSTAGAGRTSATSWSSRRTFRRSRSCGWSRTIAGRRRILRVADELIRHNVRRKEKQLFTDNAEGAAGAAGGLSDAARRGRRHRRADRRRHSRGRPPRRATSPSSIASTPSRGSSSTRSASTCVPYQIVNGLEFYQRKEIKDVLAYLHLLNNPRERRGPAAGHQHADRAASARRPSIGCATMPG